MSISLLAVKIKIWTRKGAKINEKMFQKISKRPIKFYEFHLMIVLGMNEWNIHYHIWI